MDDWIREEFHSKVQEVDIIGFKSDIYLCWLTAGTIHYLSEKYYNYKESKKKNKKAKNEKEKWLLYSGSVWCGSIRFYAKRCAALKFFFSRSALCV